MFSRQLDLPDHLRTKLQTRFILYKVIEDEEEIPALLTGNHKYIDEILTAYYDDYWYIDSESGNYVATRKGEMLYKNFIAQWWDFLLSYDIYAGVDLLNGKFARTMLTGVRLTKKIG